MKDIVSATYILIQHTLSQNAEAKPKEPMNVPKLAKTKIEKDPGLHHLQTVAASVIEKVIAVPTTLEAHTGVQAAADHAPVLLHATDLGTAHHACHPNARSRPTTSDRDT